MYCLPPLVTCGIISVFLLLIYISLWGFYERENDLEVMIPITLMAIGILVLMWVIGCGCGNYKYQTEIITDVHFVKSADFITYVKVDGKVLSSEKASDYNSSNLVIKKVTTYNAYGYPKDPIYTIEEMKQNR